MALTNMRVVLVEPQHPGNIGAVARAMKNMAFTQLALVNPADHLAPEARMMAMHARDVLQNARVCTTLAEAIEDAGFIVGTTRRLGKARQARLTPRAIAPKLIELAHSNPVAIVFGREVSGLTTDELHRCHEVVTIPTHPEFGSLNLAQAVLLVCYETYLATTDRPAPPPPRLATAADLERLYAKMREVLLRVGFLHGSNPGRMMGYFRRFFTKQGLESRDVKIFLGVFRQIEWYLGRAAGQGLTSPAPREPELRAHRHATSAPP
ncbi:MAG: RNA methyltransferase [Nitrospinae bacterium]|nr:RNA methyltransferase [Nitrospinota bacterium]